MSANLNINNQLSSLSPAKRALLEMKLKKQKAAPRVIRRIRGRTSAPLSYNQQGLWVLSRLMPGSSIYHTPTAARLRGELDIDYLRKALNEIVARHEALRTTFDLVDGAPMQVISDNLSLDLPLINLSGLPPAQREPGAQRRLSQEARRPFDLARGPLIRALLVRMADDDHILLVTMHHIVTDGWSIGVFHEELSALYESFTTGKSAELPELPIQYADYAEWQHDSPSGTAYQAQLAYWKKQFASLPPVLELPTDQPRPNAQAYAEFRGQHHTMIVPPELTRELKQLCQKENVTLFMTLLTAYLILLHRYTTGEDIVVGTPIAGRNLPETEGLIGLFINTLALRTDLSNDPTCRELLRRVKEVSLGAYGHQDLPFEQLVKEVQPERTLAHNPLFQVMFVLQSEEIPSLRLPGLTVEHFRVGNTRANFDLTLDVVERDDRLVCLFESNADLFDASTVQRMTGHFQMLLESIVKDPEQKISELQMLTDAERYQLLCEWNKTKTEYPADKTLPELFEEQVAASPDSIAIASDAAPLSFAELNRRANQLANFLKARGVDLETPVGICLDRSPEMIVAILGSLKAGAFYVPIDPCYPEARIQFMLKDAGVQTLLTCSEFAHDFFESEIDIIRLDEAWSEIGRHNEANSPLITTSENLAYVMYTSGSTGTPKGVCATHRNIVRLVKNTNYASFSADEVFFQFAPVTFDASAFEIFGSLLNGARLAIMPAGRASLNEIGAAIKQHKVTTLWLTAGLFHLMVENCLEDLQGVRQLLAGGDVLSVPHVRKVLSTLKNCRFINGYGPTENTTFTTTHPVIEVPENSSIPIGRPIANTTTYILDRYMNPVPIGVAGELYTGGDGLARGYLNRPELTAERFVRDPFSAKPDACFYKTGDLARYRANGDIEFLGRIDNQVKVRGFRIEPGEIEQALAGHPSIQMAVVVARKDQGDKHLVAYVVANGESIDDQELRNFLQQRLPDYMIPSFFVQLESLPLSPSGKIDRRALPANGFKPKAFTTFAAPADEIEVKLARTWEKVLGVRPVGIDDNFFELGGHSLLAVRLFAQVEKEFGKNLPLAMLFRAPTVRQLASVLRDEGLPSTWSSLVMIQSGDGNRLPFFCVHAAGGNVLEYHDLARCLGPDQPFYGLQARGLDGKSEPHTTIREMAAHYLREMRDVQPEGPYLLGGRSSGGTIAFEMACRLAAEGQEVALLALLDTYPAGYFKLLKGSRRLSGRAKRSAKKLQSHIRNLRRLSFAKQLAYLVNKLSYAPAKAKHKLYRRAYKLYRHFDRALPALLRNIEELNFSAVKDYTPQQYPGNATLFLASDMTADYDLHDGWGELVTGKIVVREIPGNHLNIIKEPHVSVLARELRACLDRAQSDVSTRACAA